MNEGNLYLKDFFYLQKLKQHNNMYFKELFQSKYFGGHVKKRSDHY